MKRIAIFAALVLVGAGGFGVSRVLTPTSEQTAVPTNDPLTPQVIAPRRADLRSVVVLDGVVRPIEPRSMKAARAGEVERIFVRPGDSVRRRQTLVTVRTSRGSHHVRTTIAGVVSGIEVIKGQAVEVGGTVAIVAPTRFMAEATVEPVQLYRLYEPPLQIDAQIDHGPSAFVCPFRTIGADLTGGDPMEQPVLISCTIPAEVRVFAGVRVRLAITTAIAADALVVPIESVEGSADRGVVTVVEADGSRRRQDVRLGISDGVRIQVLDGLTDDDRLLEFPESAGVTQETVDDGT